MCLARLFKKFIEEIRRVKSLLWVDDFEKRLLQFQRYFGDEARERMDAEIEEQIKEWIDEERSKGAELIKLRITTRYEFTEESWAYCRPCSHFKGCPLKPTLACSLREVPA